MTHRILLTIREAARRYGFPECAIRRWVKAGELPTIQSGSRTYIHPATIERLFDVKTAETNINGE